MISNPVPELRPLSFGQLLDRSLRLYRNNFLIFIGIVAVTQIPTLLVGLLAIFITGSSGDAFTLLENSNQFLGFVILAFLISLLGWIITQIASAILSRAAAEKYLGQEISMMEAYGRVKNDWVTLIVALIVSALLSILILVWTLIPCVGWLTGFGMLWFYSTVVVPLLIPIVVFEKRGGSDAVFRAWDLSRRKFWWVLGFTFLLTVFGTLISAGPIALIEFAFITALDAGANEQLLLIIQQLTTTLIGTLYLPIPLICFTLLYIDLRVKTEGLDLMLMEVNDPESNVGVDHILRISKVSQNWRPTGEEMGYFLGMTLAFLLIYFVLIGIFAGLANVIFGSILRLRPDRFSTLF